MSLTWAVGPCSVLRTPRRPCSPFAQAISGAPRLVVADEPTSNLDPANAHMVFDGPAKSHAKGSTVIVSTHNPGMFDERSTRSVVLEDGRLADVDKIGRARQ